MPNLEKAVTLLLISWESTGQLEQNLAFFRMATTSQKSATSPASIRCALKVLFDGPQGADSKDLCRPPIPEDNTYRLGSWGHRVLGHYRAMFGGQSNTSKTRLPRRHMKKRPTSGLAAFLRARALEEAGLQREAMPAEKLEKLEKQTANEAKQRLSESQATLRRKLQEKASLKRRLLDEAVFSEHAQKKLKAALKDEAKLLENAKVHRRDLACAEKLSPEGLLVVCVTLTGEKEPCPIKTGLNLTQIGLLKHIHWNESVKGRGQEVAKLALEGKGVIWLAHGDASEKALVTGNAFLALASRLLGGWVANMEWLNHCLTHGLVEPLLLMNRALKIPREVFLDAAIPECMQALGALVFASILCPIFLGVSIALFLRLFDMLVNRLSGTVSRGIVAMAEKCRSSSWIIRSDSSHMSFSCTRVINVKGRVKIACGL